MTVADLIAAVREQPQDADIDEYRKYIDIF
jgi:hypothetical protein